MTAPTGRTAEFEHGKDGKLFRVTQFGVPFVELFYNADGQVGTLVASGVTNVLSYIPGNLAILPKTPAGTIVAATRPRLVSATTGNLDPVEFSYEGNFLSGISRGMHGEFFKVEGAEDTAKFAERLANGAKGLKPPKNFSSGRILSDAFFEYAYDNDAIRVTDAAGRAISFAFNERNGVLSVSDEIGRKTTINYFMRYDVAYLGKVRKITDEKGRTIAGYRYDPKTGNITRYQDRFGNHVLFEYDNAGNLARMFRRSAGSMDKQPLVAYSRDSEGNATAVSRLDASGVPVATTTARYDSARQPIAIVSGNGRTTATFTRFGYLASVRNGFGQENTAVYDKYNRVAETTDGNGVVTIREYTASGFIGRISKRDGTNRTILLSLLEVEYDGAGRPISYKDASGRENDCRGTNSDASPRSFSRMAAMSNTATTPLDGS